MRRYVSFRDFDWTLLLFVLLICAVGVMQIYSATLNTKFAGAHIKQVYWILGGLLAMFAMSRLNYQALVDNVHWFYGAACLALVAVLVVGTKYLGAKRWVKLPGGVHFQPSEWVKLVLILLMAKFFHELRHRETNFVPTLPKQPCWARSRCCWSCASLTSGTALTYTPIIIMALFLGGLQFKHAIVILAIAAALVVPVWRYGLKDYQKHRLTTFMNPEADTQGKGYQSSQSIIAVGAGGIWGKGFAKGTQTQNSFVPIPQTDFIFATLAEEQGFVGAVGGATAILCGADALDRERANRARPGWCICDHGCGGGTYLPHPGERRHGGRLYAGHRNSAAALELWRIFHTVYLPGAGDRNEYPHAQVCELRLRTAAGPV
jgi:rod shape determining protein RodA